MTVNLDQSYDAITSTGMVEWSETVRTIEAVDAPAFLESSCWRVLLARAIQNGSIDHSRLDVLK
jgi:hypothetical protein